MPDRPHIVALMADHLRFDCLSCYGDLGVRTPHLDALAKESVLFERAYCSTPLCTPTRVSLATGKWPHTTRCIVNGGVYDSERPWAQIGPEHRTIYEQLDAGGYAIRQVGVHHVRCNPPLTERVPRADINQGADWQTYLRAQGFEPAENSTLRVPVIELDNGRFVTKFYHDPRHVEKTPYNAEHFQDVFWSRCMKEKIEAADPSRPNAFFFHCWAPHPPFFVPEPYFSMYRPEEIVLPENVGRWYEGMPAFLLMHTGAMRASNLQRDEWRRTWAAYFGLVTMVDECVGRVIQTLKDRGFWDDALVIFTQDHGEAIGCHRMFQKMTMYEESARIPLLVKPPKGAQGRRAGPVGHVDLAPTICDYAGLPGLPGAWGASLRRPIEDPAADWRDTTFCEFNGDHGRGFPSRAVITKRWKYIFHFCGEEELYDLANDPLETRSLAHEPELQPLRLELRGRVRDWMRQTDDILDMDRNADFCVCDWRRLDRQRGWL